MSECSCFCSSILLLCCRLPLRFHPRQKQTGFHMHVLFFLFQGPFGVLLFVYSLVLTRGVDAVRDDQGIAAESLVSSPFGHAK